MFKKILGWILVVFGAFGVICGVILFFGGSTFTAAFKILALGIFVASGGFGLARRH